MGKLRNVQALRFAAAFSVICFHLTYVFYDTAIMRRLWWLNDVGFAGVDVFFVISGFIIVTVSSRLDWSAPPLTVASLFFARRLVRVYPIYWLYFAIFTGLTLLGVGEAFGANWTLANWRWNALLLSTYNEQVPVAWSLAYELFFYLCFAITLSFGRRYARTALVAWLAAETVVTAVNHFMPADVLAGVWRWQAWSNPLVVEFVIGCLVGLLVQRRVLRHPILAVLCAVPFFVAGGWWAATHARVGFGVHDYRVPTFGVGAALLLYAVIALEVTRRAVAPDWLVRLGDASYSLYLCQELPLFAVRWVLRQLGIVHALGGVPAVVLATSAAVVLSVVSYRFAERPIVTRLQAAIGRAPARPVLPRVAALPTVDVVEERSVPRTT